MLYSASQCCGSRAPHTIMYPCPRALTASTCYREMYHSTPLHGMGSVFILPTGVCANGQLPRHEGDFFMQSAHAVFLPLAVHLFIQTADGSQVRCTQ